MSKGLFRGDMEHIASRLYLSTRKVQTQKMFMSAILEEQHFDDVALDELRGGLNEIGDYVDVMACLADDVMRVCSTFEGVLKA